MSIAVYSTMHRVAAIVLLAAASLAHGADATTSVLPQLSGLDLNLQIETATSRLASGYPTQGVIVKHYQADGTWRSQGTGGLNQRSAWGSYHLQHNGNGELLERSLDYSAANAAAVTTYRFDNQHGGTWSQSIKNGETVLAGHFTVSRSATPPAQQLAPATIAGQHVALIIKSATSATLPDGVYPSRGLVLQSYANDGTLLFQGFGPGNINSRGTYNYKKVSANTAVEETMQTSDYFSLPYTMVYTFKTATSGTWYQNLGNGMILFSGTFDTFPR